MNKNFVKNGNKIAEKLIRAIEKDTKIISSGSLSYPAIKNNLPAIYNTIVKAIANNNLSLLALWEENQGNEHGLTRSGQDFAPEEIVREFFY
ncbi:MAG: RsbRD N-terminal domain-containing protein [Xenococcaceae cyanobacterium]